MRAVCRLWHSMITILTERIYAYNSNSIKGWSFSSCQNFAFSKSIILSSVLKGYDHSSFVCRYHFGTWRSESWTHDVRPAQDKSNGSFVHLLPRQTEWVCKLKVLISINLDWLRGWKLHLCKSFKVGTQGPSRCLKNRSSPEEATMISMWSWLSREKNNGY